MKLMVGITNRIDRLLRTPRARTWVPLTVAGAVFAFAALLKPTVFGDLGRVVWLSLVAIVLAVLALLGVLSWRRLWRRGCDPYEQVVYDYGVRGFGWLGILAMPVMQAAGSIDRSWRELLSFEGAVTFVIMWAFALILWLPLGLWGGYGWGRSMAMFFGLKPSSSR